MAKTCPTCGALMKKVDETTEDKFGVSEQLLPFAVFKTWECTSNSSHREPGISNTTANVLDTAGIVVGGISTGMGGLGAGLLAGCAYRLAKRLSGN